MDSLKSLLDKKQYDLVLSLTRTSTDPEALVFRCSAFLALGKSKEALSILLDNRSLLFKANPILTMKSTLELRFILRQFDEAYEDLKAFEEMPYVSQEVEEYLQTAPKIIRSNERGQNLADKYTVEDIERILKTSKDDYEVLTLLNYLEGNRFRDYVPLLKELLVSSRHPSVKTYALLLFVSQGYHEEVTFLKNDKIYRVVPKKLKPPYFGEPFNGFVQYLQSQSPDPSIAGVAASLLNDYILDVYPEEAITKAEDPLLLTALLEIAGDYLRNPLPLAPFLTKYSLQEEDVKALVKTIQAALAKEPPLTM
jgi:hypothetical protein